MELNESNYYSGDANKKYWSVSQFKTFHQCQAKGIAEMNGLYARPETESLLLGTYIDAHFSGTMDELIERRGPDIVNKRTGEPKAKFVACEEAIRRAEQDPLFMEYMQGDKQLILTGELFGEEWKVKPDVLHKDRIVDLKYMRDTSSLFMDGERKTFIDAWGYDLQGFVYQAIIEQNVGKHLPFYLAVITKETPADIELIHIPDWKLRSAGEIIKHYLPEYSKVKNGEVEPVRCGHCDWCRETKTIERVTEYEELLERI